MRRLSDEELARGLAGSAWRREGDEIVRDVELADFGAAMAFANRVARAAERADHHPDLLVHGYREVRLRLTTHAAGGLTARDLALARTIDALAAPGPIVVREQDLGWETWPEDQLAERGEVWWKTLVDDASTPSDALVLGVARIEPGAALHRHHHDQAEVYLVLAGTGVVTVEGASAEVGPGAGVFLPGGARHAIDNTGTEELRFAYVLAADGFDEVEYRFG